MINRKYYLFAANIALSLLLLIASGLVHASVEIIRIGVLSHRGDDVTHQMWDSTANYLSYALHPKKFEVIPLDFDEVEPAIKDAAIALAWPAYFLIIHVLCMAMG